MVEAIALDERDGKMALVLRDIGGISLERHFADQQPTARQFLDLAIGITEGLRAAHDAQVIHKDVNPSNIVLGHAAARDFAPGSVARWW